MYPSQEQNEINEILDLALEFASQYEFLFFEEEANGAFEYNKKFISLLTNSLPKFFKAIESKLNVNNSQYLLSNSASVADICAG